MQAVKQAKTDFTANLLEIWAMPFVWPALWSEMLGLAIVNSISIWSALSRVGAGVVNQAINLERIEGLAAVRRLDDAMRDELVALAQGAEQLTHAGEETLADAAGGRIFSLPD